MLVKNTNPAFIEIELSPDNVQAITTTRQLPPEVTGSKSPFEQFNLGEHVGDNAQQVAKNRQYLNQLLPSTCQIQWLNQVHGSDVAIVETYQSGAVTADAVFTREKNIALAIMTADCLPILLTSKDGSEIAAIHGGWRPLAAGIIKNSISHFSCQPKDIQVWLGPCIGANAFEVGMEVRDTFDELDSHLVSYFLPRGEKYLGDLQGIAKHQLTELGIEDISVLAECTYANPHKYFSYRRGGQTGRMVSIVWCQK